MTDVEKSIIINKIKQFVSFGERFMMHSIGHMYEEFSDILLLGQLLSMGGEVIKIVRFKTIYSILLEYLTGVQV